MLAAWGCSVVFREGRRSKGLVSTPDSGLKHRDINTKVPMQLDLKVLERVFAELGTGGGAGKV